MELINSILDNIDEAILVSDEWGKILYYNKVTRDLYHLISEKPLSVGDSIMDVANPTRREIVKSIFESIRKTKSPERSFAEYTSKYGATLFLEINYVPVLNHDNKVVYVHTFIRDNTPQKVFEKKLSTLANNITNLIETANAVIIGLDTRGYITDWNKHCVKVTGFEKNEVYTKRFADIFLSAEQRIYFEKMAARVLAGEPGENHEVQVRTKAGKELTLLVSGTIRTSPTNSIIGVLLVGQDITELNQYRRSLEKMVEERTRELKAALTKEKEVVEMKSRFVSIASHEFRTPLSSIQVATNFIKKKHSLLEPDELKNKLDNIEKQIKHMNHLLDDVLTYSKNEAGKIQLLTATIRLSDFINKIIDDVCNNTKHTHAVSLELGNLPESIKTDEKLLRSILINLLNNAIKFSPSKKQVELGIYESAGNLVFAIHDYGIGIPEDECEKIFEPFLRGSTAASIQGTGLGLSIVKKAVELLNGSISVKSAVGEGTTFTVSIPYKTAEG